MNASPIENSRVLELSSSLNLTERVRKSAVELFCNLSKDISEEDELTKDRLTACCLYIVLLDIGDSENTNNIFLSDILESTNCKLISLTQSLKIVNKKIHLNENIFKSFSLLEKHYLITWNIFVKFEKMYVEIFKDEGSQMNFKRSCWLLFISIKAKCKAFKEYLLGCFYLLLCCLEHTIKTSLHFQLHPPFDIMVKNKETVFEGLCLKYKACINEVQEIKINIFNKFFSDESDTLPTYLENVNANLEINEMEFLDHKIYLTMPESNKTNGKDKNNEVVSDLSKQFATPISSTMQLQQKTKALIISKFEESKPQLKIFFNKFTIDPSDRLQILLKKLEEKFVASYIVSEMEGVTSSRELAIEKFGLAVQLYNYVLTSILESESLRLESADLSNLSCQEEMHASLLTCSLQLVLFVFDKQYINIFCDIESEKPLVWLCKSFNLKPFAIFKVIEVFRKSISDFDHKIIEHMSDIEAEVLEHLIWTKGSPVFELLANSSQANIEIKSPTKKPHPYPLNSPNKSLQQQQPQIATILLTKIYKIVLKKITLLCNSLNLNSEIEGSVRKCFESCINLNTHLLQDRHLDQILMCCLYGVCKVKSQSDEVKFKSIITAYRSIWPRISSQMIKNVKLTDGVYDTIISFYNQIFMQAHKDLLLKLCESPNASLKRKHISNGQSLKDRNQDDESPKFKAYEIGANIRVHRMQSPFKVPLSPSQMTPRTRRLYSIGTSPLSSLKCMSPSAPVVGIHSNASKKLKFDLDKATRDSPGAENYMTDNMCEIPSD